MQWKMDKKRILSKIDELDLYLSEIESVMPSNFEDYKSSIEKKRACERLLQISVEVVIDVCNLIVSELKLGLPADEDDIFNKLESKKLISKNLGKILKNMKGFRNILVHKYGTVDDELVFEILMEKLGDFDEFKKQILIIIG